LNECEGGNVSAHATHLVRRLLNAVLISSFRQHGNAAYVRAAVQ